MNYRARDCVNSQDLDSQWRCIPIRPQPDVNGRAWSGIGLAQGRRCEDERSTRARDRLEADHSDDKALQLQALRFLSLRMGFSSSLSPNPDITLKYSDHNLSHSNPLTERSKVTTAGDTGARGVSGQAVTSLSLEHA